MDSPYRASLGEWKESKGYNTVLCPPFPAYVHTWGIYGSSLSLHSSIARWSVTRRWRNIPHSLFLSTEGRALCKLSGHSAQQRDFYVRSSWQEALLPSLTSTSPGQLLWGRHRQKIMTLRGHTSARTDKQFYCNGHVAGPFLSVGWLGWCKWFFPLSSTFWLQNPGSRHSLGAYLGVWGKGTVGWEVERSNFS